MNSTRKCLLFNRLQILLSILMCLIIPTHRVNGQEKPPKPITVKVRNYQPLTFGSFIQSGDNGTVIISSQGARSATGSVFLPNTSSITTAALFDIESIPGTLITVHNGLDTPLTGGTGTMTLHIGDSFPPSPFVTTGEHTTVTIGGTLTVGPLTANPPGNYSGTFEITFIQQ